MGSKYGIKVTWGQIPAYYCSDSPDAPNAVRHWDLELNDEDADWRMMDCRMGDGNKRGWVCCVGV